MTSLKEKSLKEKYKKYDFMKWLRKTRNKSVVRDLS